MSLKPNFNKFWLTGLIATSLLVTACSKAPEQTTGEAPTQAEQAQKVSEFGRYEGYSQEQFDSWVTTSEYITTRDGTKLAADISRPAIKGVVTDEPLPVLWSYLRYHRRYGENPNIDRDEMLQRLARHGYVIVSVNVRGGGASFGRYEGVFSAVETRDAYDVIDWLSKRPYSDGNVGMYGVSYMAVTQYMAASTRHPALKAIAPENAPLDLFDALRRGGILRQDLLDTWALAVQELDKVKKPTPVDADADGSLVEAAVKDHATNFDPMIPLREANFRDLVVPEFSWLKDVPFRVFDEVNKSGVAIYHMGAWHDPYTTDTMLAYANYQGPQKLAIGPWAHGTNNDAEKAEWLKVYATEMLRWYDYWLKGIDNGIMDEPKIYLAEVDTMHEDWKWMPMENFPVEDHRTTFYFDQTKSADTPKLPNDRQLSTQAPASAGAIEYKVDPETSTGTNTRWDTNMGCCSLYPDMTENDGRSLSFTTEPMETDRVIAGIPLVKLFLSSSTPDADVYALLEEVDSTGRSNFITEGNLRVSLRKESKAPWNTLSIPWHRAYKEDQQLLTPDEVVEVNFDLLPVVMRINKGNRIRVTIMGADKDNMEAPIFPDAVLSVKTGGDKASQVSLPFAH